MSQKSLIDESAAEQLPALAVPSDPPPRTSALATLREHAMSVPVEQMMVGLAEFKERRDALRGWLMEQLVEGVHYGWSPGCEPKFVDANGKPCAEKVAAGTVDRKGNFLSFTSWRPKRSFFAAGADFVCELMGVRDELAPDNDGWVQAGSNAGTFVVNCKLISRATGELLANGLGLQTTGAEQLGANSAIKKAGKRAKVAAVLDWLGLRDLFTQDIEHGADRTPPVVNPDQKPDAPKVAPRGKRATQTELAAMLGAYKACKHPDDCTEGFVSDWITRQIGRRIDNFRQPDNWTADEVKTCRLALEDGK